MDISSRFSLVDFLAFFFPGVFGALAIYCILLFTPLSPVIAALKFDLSLAILFFVVSYVTGVLLSGISELTLRKDPKRQPKNIVQIPEFQSELLSAFQQVFSGEKKKHTWTRSSFYLCRSMVNHFMPGAADFYQRQSSLRQLKLNLIPAVFLWWIAGVLSGITLIQAQNSLWGAVVLTLSTLLCALVIATLINRMRNNEEREVREVQSAFLAGYRAGIFKPSKSAAGSQEEAATDSDRAQAGPPQTERRHGKHS